MLLVAYLNLSGKKSCEPIQVLSADSLYLCPLAHLFRNVLFGIVGVKLVQQPEITIFYHDIKEKSNGTLKNGTKCIPAYTFVSSVMQNLMLE